MTEEQIKRFAIEFSEIKIREFIKEIEECGFVDAEWDPEINHIVNPKITNVQIVIDKILYK